MIRERLTAVCDQCGRTREFNNSTKEEVDRELRKKGWVKLAADTHHCRKCAKNQAGAIICNLETETFGQVTVRDRRSRQ